MQAYITHQCPKLRVHPAPGALPFDFRRCVPGVCTFFEPVIQLHIKRVHGKTPGHTFLGEVHPVGAPNKTLISDTAHIKLYCFTSAMLQHIEINDT